MRSMLRIEDTAEHGEVAFSIIHHCQTALTTDIIIYNARSSKLVNY